MDVRPVGAGLDVLGVGKREVPVGQLGACDDVGIVQARAPCVTRRTTKRVHRPRGALARAVVLGAALAATCFFGGGAHLGSSVGRWRSVCVDGPPAAGRWQWVLGSRSEPDDRPPRVDLDRAKEPSPPAARPRSGVRPRRRRAGAQSPEWQRWHGACVNAITLHERTSCTILTASNSSSPSARGLPACPSSNSRSPTPRVRRDRLRGPCRRVVRRACPQRPLGPSWREHRPARRVARCPRPITRRRTR